MSKYTVSHSEQPSKLHERKLGLRLKVSASTSKDGVRQKPKSCAKISICADIPIGKYMVLCADPSTLQSSHPTADISKQFVHMAGNYFRVPIITRQLPKNQVGLTLKDTAVKCQYLLSRLWTLSRDRSVTASLIFKWKLTNTLANQPHGKQIPRNLAYIRHYAVNVVYITPPHNT